MPNITVYALRSLKTNRIYTGQTADFWKRYHAHEIGQVKSTQGERPWGVILTIHVPTRSQAMTIERQLKRAFYLAAKYPKAQLKAKPV
jgi:putative endonuclease